MFVMKRRTYQNQICQLPGNKSQHGHTPFFVLPKQTTAFPVPRFFGTKACLTRKKRAIQKRDASAPGDSNLPAGVAGTRLVVLGTYQAPHRPVVRSLLTVFRWFFQVPKHNSALPLHPENPGENSCRFFVQDVVGRERS